MYRSLDFYRLSNDEVKLTDDKGQRYKGGVYHKKGMYHKKKACIVQRAGNMNAPCFNVGIPRGSIPTETEICQSCVCVMNKIRNAYLIEEIFADQGLCVKNGNQYHPT